MLVRFTLELDAIDNNVNPEDISKFVKKWRNCGIMVYPDPKDTPIENVISKLNQKTRIPLRTLWNDLKKGNHTALRCQPLKKDSFSWKTIRSHNDLSQQKDKFDVALLGKDRAQKLGIPKGQAKLFGEVQGVRFSDIDQSKLEQPPSSLEPFRIHFGDQRADIWRGKFQNFAENSQDVVIVDRYAVAEHSIKGIFWLLEQLKQNSGSYCVTVHSTIQGKSSYQKIKTDVEEYYNKKRIGESGISIEIRLYDHTIADRYAHDRHIRFDNHVISIGRGLYVFKKERIDKATNCHQNHLPDGGKDGTEIDLEWYGKGQFLTFTLP